MFDKIALKWAIRSGVVLSLCQVDLDSEAAYQAYLTDDREWYETYRELAFHMSIMEVPNNESDVCKSQS